MDEIDSKQQQANAHDCSTEFSRTIFKFNTEYVATLAMLKRSYGLLDWSARTSHLALSAPQPEDRTGFEVARDVEKDGKRRKKGKGREKDEKRMTKGANIAITYRYSMHTAADFAKLDSDPARASQLQVRHGGKR